MAAPLLADPVADPGQRTSALPSRTRRRTSSLVVTPGVTAHRGASGVRPEHTLDAYRTAIRAGVDDIELDLVCTADGVLVARHENELSLTTDVATRPELAALRTRRDVDGVVHEGWFAEDLTLPEIKLLTARERFPELRPGSAAHDGREGVPTLTEVLAMVEAESVRRGRAVGVMLELKHVEHARRRGLDYESALLADLRRHDLDHPRARVTLMSFETAVLRRLATRARVQVVQLLDRLDRQPPDALVAGAATTYGDLASPAGLDHVERYADGIGVARSLVLPPGPDGELGEPTSLVREAHRRWLTVQVWTLRAENRFLPADLRSADPDPAAHGDLAAEVHAFLDAGVDGVTTDHPEVAIAAVAARG
ncbi:glycerophosphodiester phosphodiesterase family protein [Nocardioides zeae]|uniref:glycerophosphodiester phosphodiesterase n=1 Tax=Nocardioides imazamoxiresistens TaxID=3231893 RepID=A0ABU3PQK1_9ACTN|nr:glycerophosphodiester phosphodiesterase family protein [Nocardioides zeae]MDT9591513.1 glycerophosphodiester phosphodiesterase family protein [Nocardioides zeae]